MRQYLQKLEAGLRKIGVSAPILVMTSNGGMLAADVTCENPVMVVASGPAGGVVGAARLGQARDDKDVIVFDMGGTTAKAVVIEDGRPTMTSEYEFRDGISTSSRFVKAGGYMLKVPAIDIAEVGAGGGSIAGIDKGGLLTVGPHSAGAVPGPACYGLGNDKPTVTDANVVLGYINANALAGGKLQIDKTLSEKAIKTHIGDIISAEGLDAAHGIRAVANAAMARAVRAVTVERGRDPRDFTLMAFGGNGGVHAPDLARQLGIPRVVIPPMSGIFCAVGMLAADIEHTSLTTVTKYLDELTEEDLADVKKGLEQTMHLRLEKDGYAPEKRMFLWEADLRHEGQATELTVPFEGTDIKKIAEKFVAEYYKMYGYYDETPIELMKIRLIGRGLRDQRLDFKDMKIAKRDSAKHTAQRQVSFGRGETARAVDIVGRSEITSTPRPGPLVIEEFDATIVVPPDAVVSKDQIGCIVVEFSA
jgi:N-methylhydantoinase A